MKALILVGGFGTRLRPLTFSTPKPMVEFSNMPIVEHQIEALAKVGVKEVILAISHQAQEMMQHVKQFETKYNIKVTLSIETEPLGTAGPLKLAQQHIETNNPDNLFFVFNSDVICDFPLEGLIKFHKNHGKEGSIMLTQVKDPSKYGVVLYDENGKIQQFVEKPQEFIGNKINAGLYIFNTSIIQRIPNKPTSIEREIFPVMAQEGELYAQCLEGFWMDIGQPKDYLIGQGLYLESQKTKNPQVLAKGSNIIGNVIIHPTAQVHPNTKLGPDVVVGAGCEVEEGVRLQRTTLLNDTKVKAHSWVSDSIIGWKSSIGEWVRVEGLTVTGEDVHIKSEIYINGVIILPHKSISESQTEKNKVIM